MPESSELTSSSPLGLNSRNVEEERTQGAWSAEEWLV